MYSVTEFGWMIRDKARMDAYTQALKAAIEPGCIVVDLGAGTGIFSLLACQYGAGKVYAIEPNDAIVLARQLAKDNGYADRIKFIQKLSTDVDIGNRADVIVADLRGVLPLYNGNIESMIDARERMLKPGGKLIPNKDTLFAAVFSSAQSYSEIETPWFKNDYSLDLSSGRRFVTNNWTKRSKRDLKLLSPGRSWAEIDYRLVSQPSIEGQVELSITEAGTAHGVSVWFDAEIGDGAGFSNAPGQENLVYAGAQFPWPKAVHLKPGDVVLVRLIATKIGIDYIWRWTSEIISDPRQGSRTVTETFQQSSFAGQLLATENLARTADHFQPMPNVDGAIASCVLNMMDGSNTMIDIANVLLKKFPAECRNLKQARAKVAAISTKFSR